VFRVRTLQAGTAAFAEYIVPEFLAKKRKLCLIPTVDIVFPEESKYTFLSDLTPSHLEFVHHWLQLTYCYP
jgi:hypothetical protein